MRSLVVITLGLLTACEPPCAPGSMVTQGDDLQNLAAPLVPVRFRLLEGTCGSKSPPQPKVKVTAADGSVSTGTAEMSTVQPPGFPLNWVTLVSVALTPSEGVNTIELDFGNGVLRTGEAFFSRPIAREVITHLPGACGGGLRVAADSVACTSFDESGLVSVVQGMADGGTQKLSDAKLWVTPRGNLITTSDSIGWWADGLPLDQWASQASLEGAPLAVAAGASVVAVWQAASLVLLDANALSEVARFALRPCDDWCAGGATILLTDDSVVLSRRTDLQVVRFDGTWRMESEVASDQLNGSWGNEYWKCADRTIEWGLMNQGTLVPSIQSAAPFFCGGTRERPSIAGGTNQLMLLCPQVKPNGIAWESIELVGSEVGGGCFQNYAYGLSNTGQRSSRIVRLR